MSQSPEFIVLTNTIRQFIDHPESIKFYTWYVRHGKLTFAERTKFGSDMYAGFDAPSATFDYVNEDGTFFADLSTIKLVPGSVFYDYEGDRFHTVAEMSAMLNDEYQLELLMDRMDDDWLTFADVIGSSEIHQNTEYLDDDGVILDSSVG